MFFGSAIRARALLFRAVVSVILVSSKISVLNPVFFMRLRRARRVC